MSESRIKRMKGLHGFNPDKQQRHAIRLRGYDDSQTGQYFITLCTDDRPCIFGESKDGVMILNDTGGWLKNVGLIFRRISRVWNWMNGPLCPIMRRGWCSL